MYRSIICFGIFCLLAHFPLAGQEKDTDTTQTVKIEWLSWEAMLEKQQEAPRKVVVDVYTEWCGWCKLMDKTTFEQSHIARYLNDNYYCVKFDAQFKEPIEIDGKSYKFVKTDRGGYHELAAHIMKQNLRFPAFVFLDRDLNVIQPIFGYKDPGTFERIITYFATNNYMKTPWTTYRKNYVPMMEMPAKKLQVKEK